MKAMSISELCRLLGVRDPSVAAKIQAAGIADSDALCEVAPNDPELRVHFQIADPTTRKKIVAWMLKVLTRQRQTDRSELVEYEPARARAGLASALSHSMDTAWRQRIRQQMAVQKHMNARNSNLARAPNTLEWHPLDQLASRRVTVSESEDDKWRHEVAEDIDECRARREAREKEEAEAAWRKLAAAGLGIEDHDEQRRAEEEARRRAEEEARRRAEEEEARRRREEEEARRRAEEEARRRAEEEARRRAEEEEDNRENPAEGKLQIKIIGATGLPERDIDGASDPYVKFRWRGEKIKTKVIQDSCSPEWNQSFVISVSQEEYKKPVELKVWDANTVTSNDTLGEVDLYFKELRRGKPVTSVHRLTGEGASGELTVELLAIDFNPRKADNAGQRDAEAEEARRRAEEEEAKRRAKDAYKAEARRRAEENVRRRAEEEKARRHAEEEEARRRAEEEEEARRRAEEEARRRAEEEEEDNRENPAEGKLQIKIIGATGLPERDIDGASDPYVKFRWRGEKIKTKVIQDSCSPEWNESFVISVSQDEYKKPVELKVWDANTVTSNDTLGEVDLYFKELRRGKPVTSVHRLTGEGASGELTVELLAIDFNPRKSI